MLSTLLQVDSTFYTNNIVMIFGVIFLLLIGIWYYFLQKRYPNQDFGPLIATMMVLKHETVFVSIILIEYIFAAMIASSVHVPTHVGLEMNPFARFGMHMLISICGTVAQFTLARDVAIMFIKQDGGQRIGNFIVALLIAFTAFYVPYINLVLIASGAGESMQYSTWLYSINPFTSDSEYQAFLATVGYPPNYQAFDNLSTALKVCICSSFLAHILLTLIEGIRTISTPYRRNILINRVKEEQNIVEKEEKAKKDDKFPTEERLEKVKMVIPNAKFLLGRLDYKDQTKIDNLAKAMERAILGDGSAQAKEDSLKLAYTMANLVSAAKTIDEGNAHDKAELKKKNKEAIRTFISGAQKDSNGKLLPADKRGLGISVTKN